MRPIPGRIRAQLANDPFMRVCCMPGCGSEQVEWDHVFIYSGKQINEVWAIVPLCLQHHRGGGLNRPWTRYVSLKRASLADLAKYPKKRWKLLWTELNAKYGDHSLTDPEQANGTAIPE